MSTGLRGLDNARPCAVMCASRRRVQGMVDAFCAMSTQIQQLHVTKQRKSDQSYRRPGRYGNGSGLREGSTELRASQYQIGQRCVHCRTSRCASAAHCSEHGVGTASSICYSQVLKGDTPGAWFKRPAPGRPTSRHSLLDPKSRIETLLLADIM